MRLRKKWWARPALEESPLAIIKPEELKGSWHKEFGNNNPIYLELGCGRGKFISQKAEENPHINFIAVDLKDEVIVYAMQKIQEKNLQNVRLIPMNISFIGDLFSEGEISRIFINFCNPWPKERHKKRRLTHSRFLELYKGFLKLPGDLYFKTDDKGLFDESLDYFKESGFEIKYITYDLHNSDFEGNIMTEYENKFSSIGMKIMFLIAEYNGKNLGSIDN